MDGLHATFSGMVGGRVAELLRCRVFSQVGNLAKTEEPLDLAKKFELELGLVYNV